MRDTNLLAAADKRNRHADHRHNRERRAAARVAVDLGQHHAGDADLRVELAGALDRILPGHRIRDVEQVRRPRHRLDRDQLAHELVVDVQPARRVHDDHVVADRFRFRQRALRARHRIQFAGRVVHPHAGLCRHDCQLLDGRRTPHVRGHHNRVASLLLQPLRQLAGGRGLARPLLAEHQDHARPGRRLLEPAFGVAEQRQQFIPDDLDDLLARGQALENRLIHRPIAHAIDERLDDLEVDVRFEQRQPDLPEGVLDGRLRQT
jgi:hypothetical protein